MKKFFSFFAALLFAGSMMAAEPYTLKFNYFDNAGSDKSTAETKLSGLFDAASLAYLDTTAATTLENVYLGRKYKDAASGDSIFSNIKFGTSSKAGTLKFALKNMAVDSVVFRAAMYGKSEGTDGFTVNGTAFTLSAGNKVFENVTYVPSGNITALEIVQAKASSGRFYMTSITVYPKSGVVPPAVATPVISGEAVFTDSVIVTMTCSTQDADIYYTTDGTTDPKCDCAAAPEYKKPIVIKATTTIMAAAYTGNDWSAVATKTFTKKEPLVAISCAEVYNKDKGTELALNNVTVAYANGKNVYVQDATGSMLLYLANSTTWTAGNILSGVEGTLDIYNGLYEVKMTDAQATAVQPGQGEAPAPVEFTAAPVAADMNKYILLKNVTVSAETFPSNKNMNATIGGETFVLRNQFNADVAFDTTKVYDITGVVAVYNSTVQVYFINATEATAPVHTYTVAGTPAALFIEEWNPEVIENDLKPIVGGEYTHAWGKDSVLLEAGNVAFKVCENHAWTVAYPADNYVLPIAENGYYDVEIFFNDQTKAVYAEAQKVGEAPIVGVETIYNWAKDSADQVGTTIFGGNSNIAETTVKIHENADEVNAIKFGNNYVYDDGKWIAIKPAEGKFLAGDSITFAGVISNDATDGSKYAQVDFYAADQATRLFLGDTLVNGKKSADEPKVEGFVLTADQDSILLGRYGNTNMFVTLLKVTRALVPPTPPTVNYYVAGSMNGWKADENYMLTPNNESLYEGEFTFAANDAFKVIGYDGTNTTWYPDGMGNDFKITEAGDYKITFNPAGNVEGWYAGYYNVIKKEEPIVLDTVAIVVTEGLEWTDAVASQGWWQIMGENEGYVFSLSNSFTTEVPGTYTVADLDYGYSYVKPKNGTDTIHFVSGQVEVAVVEEVVMIAGALIGDDNKVYAFNLVYDPAAVDPYKYDEKEADFVYDFDSYELDAKYVAQGVMMISAQTDTTALNMIVYLPQGQTTLVAGEYPVAATPAYQTVVAGYYDPEYAISGSHAATLIEQGGKLYYNKIWYLVSGKATVDANLNITVDALNSNSKLIKANLKAKAQGVEDVKAGSTATKSLQNGILVIEKNGVKYNVTGLQIR